MSSAAASSLIKIVWHAGIGMSLHGKRLENGKFVWPSPADGVVAISAAQLTYMLDGIDWRNPRHTWRPQAEQGKESQQRRRQR
jgi:transposase